MVHQPASMRANLSVQYSIGFVDKKENQGGRVPLLQHRKYKGIHFSDGVPHMCAVLVASLWNIHACCTLGLHMVCTPRDATIACAVITSSAFPLFVPDHPDPCDLRPPECTADPGRPGAPSTAGGTVMTAPTSSDPTDHPSAEPAPRP